MDFLFDRPVGGGRLRSRVVGTMTRALVLPPSSAAHWFLGVRLRAGGLRRLLSVPAHELTDTAVDLHQVDGPPELVITEERLAAAFELLGAAEEEISEHAVRSSIRILEHFLERGLRHAAPLDPRIGAVIRLLEEDPVARSVAELGARTHLSRQHLTHRFQEEVGVGPKQFARVQRMKRAVECLRAGVPRELGLAGTALRLGYCDQAHMSRELRALTGRTPTQLFSARS